MKKKVNGRKTVKKSPRKIKKSFNIEVSENGGIISHSSKKLTPKERKALQFGLKRMMAQWENPAPWTFDDFFEDEVRIQSKSYFRPKKKKKGHILTNIFK